MKKYDAVIIGSGPGGEGAAMQLAKGGKNVALVEEYSLVGGSCTHKGTIPARSLRRSIQLIYQFRNNPLFANISDQHEVDFPLLIKSAESVIQRQVKMRSQFYERNSVSIYHGFASFIDNYTISIIDSSGREETVQADYFVLAVGSSPYRPPDVDFKHPRIMDSDTLLDMDKTPKSLTVYGAGVIGCEYASIFRNLGIKVNLVNRRPKLLEFLDDEIIDALSYHFRDQGMVIRHNEQREKVEGLEDGVVVHLKSGKKIKSDILLWADGRAGNTENINLEKIGIMVDHRNLIQVNEFYQTEQKHIYAVGDVVGFPGLASAAYSQGRFAARHILHDQTDLELITDIPTGIYTSPEISSLGHTERELTEKKIPYEVGHAHFRNLARAQITGYTVGMLKILFHIETLELLGIHCFGYQAAEIIHIGQAIMAQKGEANSLKYFVDATFNYPTMAEAYRVASLNGLNRIF